MFPLVPNAKTPALKNWQNLATTDQNQIRRWWAQDPDHNIAITTASMIVVDVDPRKDGFETLQEMQILEDWPKTVGVRTQSGGAHIYYALPAHAHVKGGADKLGRGVDIKAYGGYVVAPGSTIDGRTYTWAKDDGRAMAPAPQWLIDRCQAARQRTQTSGQRVVDEDETAVELASQWLDQHAPDAAEGERDDTGFKVAARLYDFGVSRGHGARAVG